MKAKLDKYEREIERSANAYHPVLKKERDQIEGVLDRIRKTRNINIRLSESVLEQLKHVHVKKEFRIKHLFRVFCTNSLLIVL